MPGQHADHVPALAGAQADEPYVPGGGMIELSAQMALHEFQPPPEQGTWIVVVSVPFNPVAPRHRASLRPTDLCPTSAFTNHENPGRRAPVTRSLIAYG